jgi:hypothetical protein
MTEVDGALQAVAVLKTGGRGQLQPLIKKRQGIEYRGASRYPSLPSLVETQEIEDHCEDYILRR